MSKLLKIKLLAPAVLFLATIAGGIAYRNAKDAQKEADAARSRAEFQQAMKNSSNNWGGSADTIRKYRPK